MEARNAFLAHIPKDRPSSSVTPSPFRKQQNNWHQFIPCGCPRDPDRDCEDTIPPTLLCSVFGQFIDDCQSISIETKDNRLATDLKIAMSRMYQDESQRVKGVNEVFRKHGIHLIISKIQSTDYLLDGAISVNGHSYVIAEFKNEAGNTSAEPYFEAIAYYLESTREHAPKHPSSPLPCFLLAIFGSSLLPTNSSRSNWPFQQGRTSYSLVLPGTCDRRYKSCQHPLDSIFIPLIPKTIVLLHVTWPHFVELSVRSTTITESWKHLLQ